MNVEDVTASEILEFEKKAFKDILRLTRERAERFSALGFGWAISVETTEQKGSDLMDYPLEEGDEVPEDYACTISVFPTKGGDVLDFLDEGFPGTRVDIVTCESKGIFTKKIEAEFHEDYVEAYLKQLEALFHLLESGKPYRVSSEDDVLIHELPDWAEEIYER